MSNKYHDIIIKLADKEVGITPSQMKHLKFFCDGVSVLSHELLNKFGKLATSYVRNLNEKMTNAGLSERIDCKAIGTVDGHFHQHLWTLVND